MNWYGIAQKEEQDVKRMNWLLWLHVSTVTSLVLDAWVINFKKVLYTYQCIL